MSFIKPFVCFLLNILNAKYFDASVFHQDYWLLLLLLLLLAYSPCLRTEILTIVMIKCLSW